MYSRVLYIVSFIFFVISFFSFGKIQDKKDYLKFVYIKEGEANDASYRPCLCNESLWNETGLKSLITYDEKEIERFRNYINKEKHKKTHTFMNFSNAFIYHSGKINDTIYCDSQFKYFAKNQIISKSELNYPTFECYKFKKEISTIVPIRFIKEYKKDRNR